MQGETRDELREILFCLLFQIREAMHEAVAQAEAGLTVQQISVLRTLVEGGAMSQKALGARLGKDKAQVSRVVAELAGKGLVLKTKDADDKRSFILSARPEVAQLVAGFLEKEAGLVAVMTRGVAPEDQAKLCALLTQMSGNLRDGAE